MKSSTGAIFTLCKYQFATLKFKTSQKLNIHKVNMKKTNDMKHFKPDGVEEVQPKHHPED